MIFNRELRTFNANIADERVAMGMLAALALGIELKNATCIKYISAILNEHDNIIIKFSINLQDADKLRFKNKLKPVIPIKDDGKNIIYFNIVINRLIPNLSCFKFDNMYINDDNKLLFKAAHKKLTDNFKVNDTFRLLRSIMLNSSIKSYTFYYVNGTSLHFARKDSSNQKSIPVHQHEFKIYNDLNVMKEKVYDKATIVRGNDAVAEIFSKRRTQNSTDRHIWFPIPIGTQLNTILEITDLL